ncbi:hypothetical protein K457DRAFT_558978 [Linnemannia elongata AG-77]|uniref:Uncharacterized protein n=1 Tax=Linnemannia elongata AG-77 TaxID=1314771 RepID=A0A197JWB8_9FUNG|nr:hypothetical protein K457DRAFT_558978 [Linnemannia elongata AG-77]
MRILSTSFFRSTSSSSSFHRQHPRPSQPAQMDHWTSGNALDHWTSGNALDPRMAPSVNIQERTQRMCAICTACSHFRLIPTTLELTTYPTLNPSTSNQQRRPPLLCAICTTCSHFRLIPTTLELTTYPTLDPSTSNQQRRPPSLRYLDSLGFQKGPRWP